MTNFIQAAIVLTVGATLGWGWAIGLALGIIILGFITAPKRKKLEFEIETCILKTLYSALADSTRKSVWLTEDEILDAVKKHWESKGVSRDSLGVTDYYVKLSMPIGSAKAILKKLLEKSVISKEKKPVVILSTNQENGFLEAYKLIDMRYEPSNPELVKKEEEDAELKKAILNILTKNPGGVKLQDFCDQDGPLAGWYTERMSDENFAIIGAATVVGTLCQMVAEGSDNEELIVERSFNKKEELVYRLKQK